LALAKRSFATTLVCCTSRDNLQRIHTLTFLHYDLVVYFHHMDETKIEERFNQLEKRVSDGFVRMEDGFTRMETLIETLANSSAREFASIAERFAAVDKRFEAVDERLAAIEGSIEAFSHRVDSEVEERHVLGERVLKLEKAV
jgi:aryl-alcohol dehydrogenase-like predicted oxidoreductase